MFRVQTPESGHGRVKSPPTPRHRQSPDRGERKKGTDSHSDTTGGRGRAGMKKGSSFQNGRGGTALRWREQGAQRAKAVRAKGGEPKWHYKKALPKALRGDKAKEVQSLKGVDAKGVQALALQLGAGGQSGAFSGGASSPFAPMDVPWRGGLPLCRCRSLRSLQKRQTGQALPPRLIGESGLSAPPSKAPLFAPKRPQACKGFHSPLHSTPFWALHTLCLLSPRGALGRAFLYGAFGSPPLALNGFGFRVLLLPATVSRAPSAV